MGYLKFQLSDCRLSDFSLDFSSKRQIYKKIRCHANNERFSCFSCFSCFSVFKAYATFPYTLITY